MKNLLALAAGLALSTFLVKWWIKREVAVCGLISGGTTILNPGGPGGNH